MTSELPAGRPSTALSSRGILATPVRMVLVITANVSILALLPCLGLLNWAVVPLCMVAVVLAVVGLIEDRDDKGLFRRPGPYLATIIGSTFLGMLSVVRLVIGLGFV